MEPERTPNYFYINSVDRISGNASAFVVPHHRFNDSFAYRVCQVLIPYTFYNVTSNYNVFSIMSGATIYNVTLPVGQYNLSQFITALQTGLNALAVGVFTITTDPITYNMTITNATIPFTYIGTSNSYQITGYGQSNIGPSLSITAPNIYNLGGTDYIDIISTQLAHSDTKVISSKFTSSTLIQRIPTNQYSFGQTILFMTRHPHIFTTKLNLTEDIEINLQDNNGNIINLNGRDWELVLKYYTDKSNNPLNQSRVYNRNTFNL